MGITTVLFTSREAADALGVSTRTINRWTISGRIRPAKTVAGGAHGTHVFTADEVARVARTQPVSAA